MRIRSSLLSFVLSSSLVLSAVLAAAPADAADNALKDLMKKMGAQVASGEAKALGQVFTQTKAMGKPDFANWGAIADKGKAAADKGDLDGAKATCKECHDAYRNDYKTKYGSKAP
jgi:hypothetical protein